MLLHLPLPLHLAESLGAGHHCKDLKDEGVKFFPVYSYLIVYRLLYCLGVIILQALLHMKNEVGVKVLRLTVLHVGLKIPLTHRGVGRKKYRARKAVRILNSRQFSCLID